jgi:hypothetical protein
VYTFRVSAADPVIIGALESATVTVKTNAPAAVGVPASTPLDDSVTPGGRVPLATEKV